MRGPQDVSWDEVGGFGRVTEPHVEAPRSFVEDLEVEAAGIDVLDSASAALAMVLEKPVGSFEERKNILRAILEGVVQEAERRVRREQEK